LDLLAFKNVVNLTQVLAARESEGHSCRTGRLRRHRRLILTGKLPIVRLTRRLQIDVRDLDRLVERGKEGRLH